MKEDENETAIRAIVECTIKGFTNGFATRHTSEYYSPDGTINMKIHNIFIAALGKEIQYYSALSRSFDSSFGKMLEDMAMSIAKLKYSVRNFVEGNLYSEQINFIADLLEKYKDHKAKPHISDYDCLSTLRGNAVVKLHKSDYYLIDKETNHHYLIELKIGGDLDTKKARSEKEALLEQYCILCNNLDSNENVSIHLATAYNRYGEGSPWNQTRVLQFFSKDELLISADFWNLICKRKDGFDIVIDEYLKQAHLINEALDSIKSLYLPNDDN